jgi:hypothetical protein
MTDNQYTEYQHTEQGAQDIVLLPLQQIQIDWLLKKGVAARDIINPDCVFRAHGKKGNGGFFVPVPNGDLWFAFRGESDTIFYRAKTGEYAWATGRAFGIGEELIDNPASSAFDQALQIFSNPIEWLSHGRNGVVILKWGHAFDRLREVPRISITEELLATYQKHMKPRRLPKIIIRAEATSLTRAA